MNKQVNMRWFIRFTALLLGIETAAAGYLSSVGPSALRFQQPRTSKTAMAVLPPLPAVITNSASAAMPQTATLAPAIPQQESNRSTNNSITVQSSPSPALPLLPEAATNDVLVTPQMLLQFFTQKSGHSSGGETSVVLPMNFVPPQTTYRPSSTASYESP